MGCTPTAQRLNSIPSSNVKASMKSTKSTVKYSDHMFSPPNLTLEQKSNQRQKIKRYYSPKYAPAVKARQEGFYIAKKKEREKSEQKYRQKNGFLFVQRIQTKKIDIVSHLSLNSHYNQKQKLQCLQFQAYTPEKKRQSIEKQQQILTNPKSQKRISQKNHHPRRIIYKQPNNQFYLLQKQLRNINVEKFEKIMIKNRNF